MRNGALSFAGWGLALLLTGGKALAQAPTVTAVVNAGSATTVVAPGTLVYLYGTNLTLSPTGCQATGGVAWTTSLCNSEVMVDSIAAPLEYVGAMQINFQIPFGLSTGPGTVTVMSQGGQSAPFPIQLSAFAPAVVAAAGTSGVYHSNGTTLVSSASPAAVKEALTLYAYGLGPTNPFVAAGGVATASPVDNTVTTPMILIDGTVSITPVFSALAANYTSLYQVNFVVPTLSPGTHTLAIQSGGITSPTVPFYVAPLLFFENEVSLGGQVYYLQFPDNTLFGYFNYASNTIIFHYDMGFEGVVPGSVSDIYFYDFTSGHWWYTSTSLFPYLYDFTLKTWIYYFAATNNPGHYSTNPRYFSNLTTAQIFTM